MTIVFSESYLDEFHYFNAPRAQAWLRGKGIEDSLIYENNKTVCIEVPSGTDNDLCLQAVVVGAKTQ